MDSPLNLIEVRKSAAASCSSAVFNAKAEPKLNRVDAYLEP